MPAQVPAGFTRGSIQFFGALTSPQTEEILLQDFWSQAGGYGARIAIFPASADDTSLAERYTHLFSQWHCDSAKSIWVSDRAAASDSKLQAELAATTGMLILGKSPLRFASTFGGTPLAQALRRANAQGKVIAGLGGCGSVLCQHMIAFDNRSTTPWPLLHRQLIQLAPGLGLVNRLLIDGVADSEDTSGDRISRLLTAVAYNPFLVGVSLEADTGISIYANGTFEVFGQNSALVIDGNQLNHTNLHEVGERQAISVTGIQLHVLTRGYTYNYEEHTPHLPVVTDIPPVTNEIKAAF